MLKDIYSLLLWYEQGRWLQPPLPFMFFSHWHETQVVKRMFPGHTFHTAFSVDGYGFQHLEDVAFIKALLKKKHSENSLGEYTALLDAEGKRIMEALTKELEHDDEYVRSHIDEIFALYKEFAGFWCCTVYIGDNLTWLATEVGFVNSEADLFGKVHPHLRKTWIEEESQMMREIAQKSIEGKNEEVEKEIDEYLGKYKWATISKWIGEPMDKAYAEKRLQEEIKNIEQNNYIESTHSTSPESKLEGILQLCIGMAYWRATCGKMEMNTALRMRALLKEIGDQNGCSYEKVVLLSPSELATVLKDPHLQIENKEVVFERQKEFCSLVDEKGDEVVLTLLDPEYQKIKDLFVTKVDQSVKIEKLKGVPASPGFTKGKVRVIASSKEFSDFQEGEILVAPETTPSFVPLMRLASAILTGKGGITSHAAIVSRELKKPCDCY